jgi:hypothetical protein
MTFMNLDSTIGDAGNITAAVSTPWISDRQPAPTPRNESSVSSYIDQARVLVDLAAHARSEQARSEFMLLATFYRELAATCASLHRGSPGPSLYA